MSEITLEAIEQLLDAKLKQEISPINTNIGGVKTVMAKLATSEELKTLDQKLTDIKDTVNRHTSMLDGIGKDVQDWTRK